jgi:aminobenzoyl-glutamate transport protein
VVFLVVWTLLLIVWMLLGLPTGPGAPLFIGVAQPDSRQR